MRKKTRLALIGALALASSGLSVPFAGSASASGTASVTTPQLAPSGAGNGGFLKVNGTGFPAPGALNYSPTGITILECSDPSGTAANLPTNPDFQCDGTTQVPGIPDPGGSFSYQYPIEQLNTATGSVINCDATHYCVLWSGQDYENDFSDPSTQAFSRPFLVVNGVAPAFTSASLAGFPTFTSTSFTVTTSGVDLPSIGAAGLPSGVTFHDNGNGTGTLSGKPSAAGVYTVTLTASNGVAPTATQHFTLDAGLQITTPTSLPGATAGVAYTSPQLTAVGGTTPYAWKVKGLPKGLKASKTGVISGTVIAKHSTRFGLYTLTVTVSDTKIKGTTKHPNPEAHGKESSTKTLTINLAS